MTKTKEEALATLAIVDAAKEWWRDHRPVAWSEDQHIDNPSVNISMPSGKRLAEAVSRMVKLGQAK